MKVFLILRIEKGDYYNSEKDAYVPLKDATVFYDEVDAESTLSWLDDSREWCHSLIEKEVPSIEETTFFVSYAVDGRFTAEVKASSLDEAKKKAEAVYASASFGQLETIDSYPCVVEDEEGNILWER